MPRVVERWRATWSVYIELNASLHLDEEGDSPASDSIVTFGTQWVRLNNLLDRSSTNPRVVATDGKVPEGDQHAPVYTSAMDADYEGKPTEEEMATLRRVPGKLPLVAYLLCAVEFCERASYYGCQGLYSNFVNRPLPQGGNGWGAPPRGTQQTPGALGLGETKAVSHYWVNSQDMEPDFIRMPLVNPSI